MKLKQGDKAGAKRLLAKKKKLLEQLKQTEGAMAMMEEQKMMLESAGATKETFDTFRKNTLPTFYKPFEENTVLLIELR